VPPRAPVVARGLSSPASKAGGKRPARLGGGSGGSDDPLRRFVTALRAIRRRENRSCPVITRRGRSRPRSAGGHRHPAVRPGFGSTKKRPAGAGTAINLLDLRQGAQIGGQRSGVEDLHLRPAMLLVLFGHLDPRVRPRRRFATSVRRASIDSASSSEATSDYNAQPLELWASAESEQARSRGDDDRRADSERAPDLPRVSASSRSPHGFVKLVVVDWQGRRRRTERQRVHRWKNCTVPCCDQPGVASLRESRPHTASPQWLAHADPGRVRRLRC